MKGRKEGDLVKGGHDEGAVKEEDVGEGVKGGIVVEKGRAGEWRRKGRGGTEGNRWGKGRDWKGCAGEGRRKGKVGRKGGAEEGKEGKIGYRNDEDAGKGRRKGRKGTHRKGWGGKWKE